MGRVLRFFLSIILIFTALTFSGCGGNNAVKDAENFLKGRYNGFFKVDKIEYDEDYDIFVGFARTDGRDPEVLFTMSKIGEDGVWSDTFVERAVSNRIAEQVARNLSSLPGDVYVFVRPMGPKEPQTDSYMPIDEYMSGVLWNQIRIDVVVSPDSGAKPEDFYEPLARMFLNGMYICDAYMRLFITDINGVKESAKYFISTRGRDSLDNPEFPIPVEKSVKITYNKGLMNEAKEWISLRLGEIM